MELTLEQQRMIRSKPSRYSTIRGIRGSGKTTASIYRSLYLKNNYCLYEEDKILMLASKDEDINYIEDIYNKVEKETRLDYLTLFSNNEIKFHVVTLESILHRYFLEYKSKYKLKNEQIIGNDKKNSIMKNCILDIKNIYPSLRILHASYVEFFIEEVKWMKSCNYLKIDAYLQCNRTGRKCEKGQGPQKIPKNSTARKAIFQLMLTYNEKLRSENLVDNEDINIYALLMAETVINGKYCHIIVDKSNDLTKVQLDFINALFKEKSYSNMMFLVDIDMIHNTNSWMVKGKRVNSKPLGEKAKIHLFKNNYKTQEILQKKQLEIKDKNLDIKSLENFQFCDLRHSRSYKFMRDYSRISDILLNDENGDYEYINEELLELPVYSDIAAGEPILINSEIEGKFYLPKYWLKGVKNAFILKVKGDSMIGANINHGDYVIIRQEHAANNKDIVAVDIGGNATLKRLSINKDRVLLMPENEKYKPIVIDSEDTYIIGTAIGIIKHKN
ncbi:LexA family transcriptional regulator [Clostridium tagluense]|uniref:LexA family protein n=1 Tax=Clostridium tagluense TaxID=360422 RepID=UPI001C0D68FD|nr:LexA family transcriptional regulator [Clostridium tagluense]MBU3128171.1 LexA family transcriptional regulator [Clostridium tagluense]MCB2312212.1 LexA family transcriptional regulator [Clostridium tagluense]MCB2316799.1 LexA family transcriptional regulator [Clostridium tagluense]MCB2321659.1 LexA family transcriptional regulator [Clostridium tagluense]MCB2326668.1 LexA family transcriptional regulator [Clostridium tagluense]